MALHLPDNLKEEEIFWRYPFFLRQKSKAVSVWWPGPRAIPLPNLCLQSALQCLNCSQAEARARGMYSILWNVVAGERDKREGAVAVGT